MAGMSGRFSTVIKAKINRMLDKAEDPADTLEYSYQKQMELLQQVKKGIADVVTSKKRLQLQQQKLEQQVVKLDTPLDSGSFMKWGERGKGAWITVYTNPGHAYAVIAGLRLDTSVAGMSRTMKSSVAATAFESGPRWRPMKRSASGFVKRHPTSF